MNNFRLGNLCLLRNKTNGTCVETEHGGYWSFLINRNGKNNIYVYNYLGEAPGLEEEYWLDLSS